MLYFRPLSKHLKLSVNAQVICHSDYLWCAGHHDSFEKWSRNMSHIVFVDDQVLAHLIKWKNIEISRRFQVNTNAGDNCRRNKLLTDEPQ